MMKNKIKILQKMVSDFAKAMTRSAKEGFPATPRGVYLSRRHRCNRCTSKAQCPHCNCVLWLKCSMATEECPLGYWPKFNDESPEEYDKKVSKKEIENLE